MLGLSLAGALVSVAAPLAAQEFGRPLVQVTNATSALYNVDNRDKDPLNDDWGVLLNRLNAQATSGPLTLSARLDGAWFFTSPEPQGENAFNAGLELSNRYINWIYPSKYTLLYTGRDFEIALGDSTAQLGRGLVLSLRKLDELASDTTLRGLRATGRVRLGAARVKLTALAGSINPLRIDEASGRMLGVDSSVTPGFLKLTEAGMPRALSTDFVPEVEPCARFRTCSYAPDRLLAGGIEVALPSPLVLGTQASLLLRQEAIDGELARRADRMLTASQSVELPRLFENGSLYVEVALQKMTHDDRGDPNIALGHAVYAAASWTAEHFSLLAEGRHYRRFFPLRANVSLARAREFSLLQYSAPPTNEEFWNDTQFGNFNTCVSGGRIRGDAHVAREHTVYAWVGRATTWAERGNERCETSEKNANHVWESGVGLDLRRSKLGARADIKLGSRSDDAGQELSSANGSHVFYRELYLRYDVSVPIKGPVALELQGFHRRRREPDTGRSNRWLEGQHSTGIDWGAKLSFAVGTEYDTRPENSSSYFNVMATYRPSDAVSLGLFAGQRRGTLRCVGGVCRVYPPFEGARLDVTIRY